MSYFEYKNNDLVFVDDYINLKITSNREVYYKLKTDLSYSILTKNKVPLGFSVDDKKALLVDINKRILENYGNEIDTKVNGNKDKEEKDNGMEN